MSAQESIDQLRKALYQSYEDEIARLRAENTALRSALRKEKAAFDRAIGVTK